MLGFCSMAGQRRTKHYSHPPSWICKISATSQEAASTYVQCYNPTGFVCMYFLRKFQSVFLGSCIRSRRKLQMQKVVRQLEGKNSSYRRTIPFWFYIVPLDLISVFCMLAPVKLLIGSWHFF